MRLLFFELFTLAYLVGGAEAATALTLGWLVAEAQQQGVQMKFKAVLPIVITLIISFVCYASIAPNDPARRHVLLTGGIVLILILLALIRGTKK